MHIWIYNPFDDIPGEGPKLRYWTLAELLTEAGHTVIWWSADFSHRRKKQRVKIETRSRVRENVDQHSEIEEIELFDLRLIPVRAYTKNISFKRLLSHRDYGRTLVREGRKEPEPPDLIVASTPPLEGALAALQMRKVFGCEVILDIQDAWPDTFRATFPEGKWGNCLAAFVLAPYQQLANRICREVDRVSAVSKAFAAFAVRRGFKGTTPYVVYLGAPIRSRSSDRSHSGKTLKFVYLGAMGQIYDLETVMVAVALLVKANYSFSLELAGNGGKEKALRKQVERMGLGERVLFRGYLKREALDRFLLDADVALCPMFPDSQVACPNKVCEYAGAGLPIVNSLPGELADLLETYQAGCFYEAGNAESLASAMRRYLDDPELACREGEGAFQLAHDLFDRNKTYREWADWIASSVKF